MSDSVKLAEYLFTRLKQLGVGAVHGVPGDYNLNLLDFVEPLGLLWVGNVNELNAGYAADGYARMKGLGALVTTYGVGELSAINAVACAYAERAAVVHIVGTPRRDSQDSRLMIHHTLGDGEYRHFSQMYSHVTVAQTNLVDSRTSPQQIDEVLRQCVLHSRPVYIEVPVDMVAVPVLAASLSTEISTPEAVPNPAHDIALAKVLEKVYAAKQPLLLVDGETRALDLLGSVQWIINTTKWPVFTTISGNGLVDMTLPNVHGIYKGTFADARTKKFVDDADLILCFGPHFSSTNTYNWSSIPKENITISFTQAGITIGHKIYRDISAKHAVSQLVQRMDLSKVKRYNADLAISRNQILSFSEVSDNEVIEQAKLWRLLAGFLRAGDIILSETGTAGYGVREMPLPKHARLFSPITWLSIGYMLPASQGAALAQRELIAKDKYHGIKDARTILLIGDGSFQMTVQELATIIRHNLNVVVFLINNDGYTIERCIHGKNQSYNDIGRWRYLQAPNLFGAHEGAYTGFARTYGELEKVLGNELLADGRGLRMVEVFLDREDAPEGPLLDLLNEQKRSNDSSQGVESGVKDPILA